MTSQPKFSAMSYVRAHRRVRRVLAASMGYFAVASFALVAALMWHGADLSSTPMLVAALAGCLAGQWLGGSLGRCSLPDSRLAGAMLLSVPLIAWAALSGSYVSAITSVFGVYLLIFWFSRAGEELLSTLVAGKVRRGVSFISTAVFVGSLVAGIFGAGLLILTWPRTAGPATWLGLSALAGLWLVTIVSRYRRAPMPWPAWLIYQMGFFAMRFYHGFRPAGRCRLPARGPAILAATHVSAIDPLLIQTCCSRLLHWMIAREYFDMPVLKWVYRLTGSLPVNRTGQDIAATRRALRLLRDGEVLALFPHGRIRLAGQPELDLKEGAAMLALISRAPLVPARIIGLKHRGMIRDWLLPHRRVTVEFGKPVELADLYDRGHDRDVVTEATRRLEAALRLPSAIPDAEGKTSTSS